MSDFTPLRRVFAQHKSRLVLTYTLFGLEMLGTLLRPLFLGRAVDGLLDGHYVGLGQLMAVHAVYLLVGTVRHLYDTRTFTAIYTGLVAPMQARRADEMQAVADALSLLANVVMAWNTAQMQAVLDRWSNRRQVVPTELLGRIAPTRLEGINLRGVFRFPVERYAGQLMPSQTAPKTSASS